MSTRTICLGNERLVLVLRGAGLLRLREWSCTAEPIVDHTTSRTGADVMDAADGSWVWEGSK